MDIIHPKPTATVYPAPYPLPGVPLCSYPGPLPQHLADIAPMPYHGPDPNSASIGFLRRLLAVSSIAAFLITACLILSVWFILRPRLVEISISSSTISNLNISVYPPQLSATFDITLSIRNPNKNLGIFYREATAAVIYAYGRRDRLAEMPLPDFSQRKHNSTLHHIRLVTASLSVDPDHAGQISSEVSRRGMVRSQVWVTAVVHFNAGTWKIQMKEMTVHCDDVAFIVYNGGTSKVGLEPGSPKSCTVNLADFNA